MKRFILFIGMALVIVSPFAVSAIEPNALTEEEVLMIARNCRDAQRSLQRIQYVDPVTRVSRGNAIASVIKLMSALNARAAANTYNIPALVTATNNVQKLRQDFADDYTAYEIGLREVVTMDCSDNPIDFYRKLTDVRNKRAALSVRSKEIEQQLDQFSQHIPDLANLVKDQQ
ncbi:MAG: hypothetical protein WBB39_02140 [Candidatus Saccharimonadales bacterium]